MRGIALSISLGGQNEASVKALQHSGLPNHSHETPPCMVIAFLCGCSMIGLQQVCHKPSPLKMLANISLHCDSLVAAWPAVSTPLPSYCSVVVSPQQSSSSCVTLQAG